MNWLEALILGIVQGATEFFSISSSGHLLLVQWVLGVEVESSLLLSVIFHCGTLGAVVVMLWKSILKLFFTRRDKLLYLILATIPAAIIGLLFSDLIDEVFYKKEFLPIFFMLTAVVLLLTEVYAKKTKHNLMPMDWKSAGIMGLAQAIAVIPGISRSGMTISAGVLCRNDREEVAKMSFMMSIPVIGGSLLLNVVDLIQEPALAQATMETTTPLAIIVGVVAAFVTGMVAIRIMLKSIRRANYKGFAIYLFVLSVVLIINNWQQFWIVD